jgi:hypothetical protein
VGFAQAFFGEVEIALDEIASFAFMRWFAPRLCNRSSAGRGIDVRWWAMVSFRT